MGSDNEPRLSEDVPVLVQDTTSFYLELRPQDPGSLVFNVGHKEVFRVLPGGKAQVAEGVDTDEAAQAFWDAVDRLGSPARKKIVQLEKELDRVKATCRDEVGGLKASAEPQATAAAEAVRAAARELMRVLKPWWGIDGYSDVAAAMRGVRDALNAPPAPAEPPACEHRPPRANPCVLCAKWATEDDHGK